MAATGRGGQREPLHHAARDPALRVLVEKGPERIVVVESRQGLGHYEFDYRLTAVRNGYEDYRVIRSNLRRGFAAVGPVDSDTCLGWSYDIECGRLVTACRAI